MEPIAQHNPCPQCGIRAIEFNLLLKFGCEHCYVHFQKETTEILEIMQQHTLHIGKTPKRFRPSLTTLKIQLKSAILEERYEDAGLIQKRIDNNEN